MPLNGVAFLSSSPGVYVVAGTSAQRLTDELASPKRKGTLAKAEMTPQGKVAMPPDAWDKCGSPEVLFLVGQVMVGIQSMASMPLGSDLLRRSVETGVTLGVAPTVVATNRISC